MFAFLQFLLTRMLLLKLILHIASFHLGSWKGCLKARARTIKNPLHQEPAEFESNNMSHRATAWAVVVGILALFSTIFSNYYCEFFITKLTLTSTKPNSFGNFSTYKIYVGMRNYRTSTLSIEPSEDTEATFQSNSCAFYPDTRDVKLKSAQVLTLFSNSLGLYSTCIIAGMVLYNHVNDNACLCYLLVLIAILQGLALGLFSYSNTCASSPVGHKKSKGGVTLMLDGCEYGFAAVFGFAAPPLWLFTALLTRPRDRSQTVMPY